ncbi:MAG: hypothetical protein R2845_01350 [Thermomicrobiales bacterium]
MAERNHAAPADSHDVIRVTGGRENNLKNVNLEIPKRRLTVFTGVSGSGKSSLVFGTIAAESQRLINETYSAFLQGFMPVTARPDVDLLEGLTPAIIVDQERMGANARSTVGTATDANAILRILFSRLGDPHIGSPNAYSFNTPSVKASGTMVVNKKGGEVVTKTYSVQGGMCPRCDGNGTINDIDLTQLFDDSKSLSEGALTIPGYNPGGWNVNFYSDSGFLDPEKPIRDYTEQERHDFLYKEPTKVKYVGANHLRGTDSGRSGNRCFPKIRMRCSATHSRLRRRGGDVHSCPECGGTRLAEAARSSKINGKNIAGALRDADQRSGGMGARARRTVGGAAVEPCSTCSIRSSKSVSATSRSTGHRAPSRAGKRNGRR